MSALLRTIAFLGLLAVGPLAAAQSDDFQPWSDKVFDHIAAEYGEAALKRMLKLHDIIEENYDQPIETKLKVTNYALNHLPWITDQQKYRQNDYWATPLETIATFGGDCEDIAISKFIVLRHMGVPADNLRLTYVKIKRTGESHMVLTYLAEPDAPPGEQQALVLDNYVQAVLPGKKRTDLLAVYMVDAQNNVTLINDDGHTRTLKAEIDNAKFSKLDQIKVKMAENRALYLELNDGRPLF